MFAEAQFLCNFSVFLNAEWRWESDLAFGGAHHQPETQLNLQSLQPQKGYAFVGLNKHTSVCQCVFSVRIENCANGERNGFVTRN